MTQRWHVYRILGPVAILLFAFLYVSCDGAGLGGNGDGDDDGGGDTAYLQGQVIVPSHIQSGEVLLGFLELDVSDLSSLPNPIPWADFNESSVSLGGHQYGDTDGKDFELTVPPGNYFMAALVELGVNESLDIIGTQELLEPYGFYPLDLSNGATQFLAGEQYTGLEIDVRDQTADSFADASVTIAAWNAHDNRWFVDEVNGQYVMESKGDDSLTYSYFDGGNGASDNRRFSDFLLEVDGVQQMTGNAGDQYGILFRSADPGEIVLNGYEGYLFLITSTQKWELRRYVNGTPTTVAQDDGTEEALTGGLAAPNRITIEARDSVIRVWINDNSSAVVTFDDQTQPYVEGFVGFVAHDYDFGGSTNRMRFGGIDISSIPE